ncbi:N-acetylmuramidase domain-containing protein [Pseudomonas sp.]|uniref:N-acetylmuramidase domain-containing protein n=1 Tax=Pseudomonas sp. TaxID=306 RepID=UPI002D15F491|nr:N-acetylmuramidase domain-containing protein [Pseudomonas sp.]HUE91686.1 N-acetylmuramidase domain-containing protein [Pseudomonas sp.]
MADSKPINWAYPFPSKETSSNPLQYLTHMAKAKDGYYPTGENGLWHGGVHFDEGTAAVLDQSSVRCIADGEVIAYRIDETYPVSEYTEAIPQIRRVPFSTGFVLVKHKLQPPQPNNGTAAASEEAPPTLTFYSLYMHLQDWASYQAKADLPRPGFWEAASYIVNTRDQGLNVRAAPNTNGTVLAMLSKGAQITVGSPEGDFCKLLSIISGAAQPALTPDSEGKLPGYVSFRLLKAQHDPKDKNSVVVLRPGTTIKAGELIGHLGTYQNHAGSQRSLLHLEVFSCEDVPGFIAQSSAWASRLLNDQKTLLKIYKGASKLIAHRDDINADNPPKLSDAGSQISVDLIIPQALLEGLPASNKIQVKTPVEGSTTPSTTYWWRLDGLFADENGNSIGGWLAEQDLITTRHSPWEWPDFQCIEDTGTPIEKLAYTFNARGMLSDDEKQNYRAQISKADGGPILAIARLYDIVDTDKDGVLTSAEIQAALAKPWHAQVLGQLLTKYESEWFWNKDKWDELDPLLAEELGKPNPIWEVEKQRIEKLSWWKELTEQHGISGDGKAWHFNAVSLISMHSNKKRCFCFEQGIVNMSCQQGEEDVSKDHFELLATQLGVEREVLRAIAVAETGDKVPFKEFVAGEQHALILYERHYMRRLLIKAGYTQAQVNQLSIDEPKIVHAYESNYAYGSLNEQHTRLIRARELNEDAANMSCSWGKFQVMGEYYKHLYKTTQELVEAQNHCALQHLQYFKVFLTDEKRMLNSMKTKDWTDIAEKYNGRNQVGYDIKIENAYKKLKENW